jgi:DNA-binding CsgD family transcriptional regulator
VDEARLIEQAAPCCCRADHFTAREIDVLCQVAAGLTNDEAAATLGISTSTVAGHLREMLNRCGVRRRAELVARAYAAGVLTPGEWPPRRTGRRCIQLPAGAANGHQRN